MAAPIVHIEFRSASFERTAAFYAQLFDWRTQQNASSSYMKLDGADGPTSGWIRSDLAQAPAPVPYVIVDDLAAKMAQVEKAGGRVLVAHMPFSGGGEVGLFADPDGNVIGLWMRKKNSDPAEAKAPEAKAPEVKAVVTAKKPAPAAAKKAAPAKAAAKKKR